MNGKRKKQERKKERNIITETDKRNGTVHLAVAKRWPDGKLFRRRCVNLALARNLLTRINASVIAGTWRELRDELSKPKPDPVSAEPELTVSALADISWRNTARFTTLDRTSRKKP